MKSKPTEEKLNNFQNETPKYALSEQPPPQTNIVKGILFIVISAFCYSLMSLFVRLSGPLPTFQKAFFRNLIATIAACFILIKSGSFKIKKGSMPALLGRSIAGTIGILCNFYAIDNMNISDASILNKLAPFFSIVFSILILKEKTGWKDWLLVGIAFSGALFVVKPTFEISQSFPAVIGVMGGLGAGLAYTYVRKLGVQGERTAAIVFFFSAFSCLTMFPVAMWQWQPMSLGQTGFLILAGIAASGAQFTVTKAYIFAPAKEISVYDYSQVLFTALWGALFLTEFPDWLSVVGYAIIIGAAIAKYFLARKK